MAIRLGAHNLFGSIPVQVELIWNFNWMKICAFRAVWGEGAEERVFKYRKVRDRKNP